MREEFASALAFLTLLPVAESGFSLYFTLQLILKGREKVDACQLLNLIHGPDSLLHGLVLTDIPVDKADGLGFTALPAEDHLEEGVGHAHLVLTDGTGCVPIIHRSTDHAGGCQDRG